MNEESDSDFESPANASSLLLAENPVLTGQLGSPLLARLMQCYTAHGT